MATPAWQEKRVNLNRVVLMQKAEHLTTELTIGNLKAPVTTKPSKLKKGSKAANRRKSFCARMLGMKKRHFC